MKELYLVRSGEMMEFVMADSFQSAFNAALTKQPEGNLLFGGLISADKITSLTEVPDSDKTRVTETIPWLEHQD